MLVAIVACACGKGGDQPSPSQGAAGAAAAAAPAKKGATGSVNLSGALTGTFSPSPDIPMSNCGWVDSVKTGALDVTMSDGKDTLISLSGALHDGKYEIKLSSGKLKLPHAFSMTGSSGLAVTGTTDQSEGTKSNISVTYSHAVVTGDDQSVTIDGQISARCE
jgi:hypothetical protein